LYVNFSDNLLVHAKMFINKIYFSDWGVWLWWLRPLSVFQEYFSYIVAVSFIGWGNRSTQRKPPTCQKSLTNFTHWLTKVSFFTTFRSFLCHLHWNKVLCCLFPDYNVGISFFFISGRCYPCSNTVEITCFCKITRITVPCGREKITKIPRCHQQCRLVQWNLFVLDRFIPLNLFGLLVMLNLQRNLISSVV